MDHKISIEDLGQYLKKLFPEASLGDKGDISRKMQEFWKYCSDNYSKLSSEAQEKVDSTFDLLREHLACVIGKLPEGREKRKSRRMFASATGKHWRAKQLVDILRNPPAFKTKILEQVREVFVCRLQDVLDLLFDVGTYTHRGSAQFAQISLLYLCVDELLVGFHLAQRAFTNQAYAHIRTIHECLDKVTLFAQQPKWAEVWAGEDEKQILKELSPAGVREKLGRKRFDRIYSFFSTLGPHGSFEAIRIRSAMNAESSVAGKTQIHMWLGGCPQEHQVVMTNWYLSCELLNVLGKVVWAFSEYLDKEETKELLQKAINEFRQFTLTHVVQWAKKSGLDMSEIEGFLDDERIWNLETIWKRNL